MVVASISSEKVAVTLAAGSTPVAFAVGTVLVTLGAVVSEVLVIVVVFEPTLPTASLTHTRVVFGPSASWFALTLAVLLDGEFVYVLLSTSVPVEQSVPPTRTEYEPFSLAFHVIVLEPVA